MLTLPGISIQTQIYESPNSLVYRGIREEDYQPIILKVLKENYPTPQELARYRTEYEITKSLNLSGVVKVYDLQKYQNTLVMSIEDFGGESLKIWMQQRTFTLEEFLQIAITTTAILGQIHAANIIHKDINPSNIVFNQESGEIKIIDFGISTKLNRENPTIKNPNLLEGTLAYISPEQTGRMNRSLDYRTDFYSLGITFYELLTHKLPFITDDLLELVHCHIAKQPLNPTQINIEIPQVIANIIMKLIAKTAEDRYQSALGIKADLEECLKQLKTNGNISDFVIGNQDISGKFQLPQKLYGREKEIQTLLTAFERVISQSEMILIGGYSGIGKTVLVQEIYKPITKKRGYFISGKFDQYQRNIPYSAIVNALRKLVKQLLGESENNLQKWREKLLVALGINGQIIIDVINEVELIIGKQPPVAELGLTETQNRFNLVFQNFIKVFVKPEHPLVLFIDDLQWADGASLKLIQLLINANTPGLFLIGAYRDNEVSSVHPLILTIEEIRKNGIVINQIILSALTVNNVNQIIVDTLKCIITEVQELTELLYAKTGGNPFFMNEFLKSLYTEKLLKFNVDDLAWTWNIEKIKQRNFTENVMELMADKIKNLPENTQDLLKFAACIANQFDIITLSLVTKQSLREIVNILQSATNDNLIIPLGGNEEIELALLSSEFYRYPLPEYKFAHDRIQQAAYSLIPDEEKVDIHYKIGKILLQNIPDNKQEEKIFDIVSQLNFGLTINTQGTNFLRFQTERDQLAQLNLIAGKKAKISAAYQPALSYVKTGIELLAIDSWQQNYKLTLSLYEEAAELAYLNADFDLMEQLADQVLLQAKTVLEKVKIYEVKIQAYTSQGKLNEAIDTALEILKLLGVRLPQQAKYFDVMWGLARTKFAIGNRAIASLIDLSVMTNPCPKAAMRILSKISATTYSAAPLLFSLIVFQQVSLSIMWGNSSESAFAYSCYGLILLNVFGDIKYGYQFGQLAIKLIASLNDRETKARTQFVVSGFIAHWIEHLETILIQLKDAYIVALETGDLEYGSYSFHFYSNYAFLKGKELGLLESEIADYIHFITPMGQERSIEGLEHYHQVIRNLLGWPAKTSDWLGNIDNEQVIIAKLLERNDRAALFSLYFTKLMLAFIFNERQQAIINSEYAEQFLDGFTASLIIPHFYFYYSLASMVGANNTSLSERNHLIQKVHFHQRKMRKWAHYAPMNNSHKYWLVEAELCRVKDKDGLAMEYYDRAISLAKENEYIHEAAIAYELAAKFYLAEGKELIAKTYMQEARYHYQLWGAKAKVKHLEQNYPQLLTTIAGKMKDSKIYSNITTTGSGTNIDLDIATIMKANQAISGEIMLGKLLSSLMKILIENAGAETGYLILYTQEKLVIEAVGGINSDDVTFLESLPVNNCQILSEAIVNYVARTKEIVVLNDASCEGNFTSDRYIQTAQPKSILCVPLINQSKLISIVYLENNLTTGVFTNERVEVLNLLSAQAAISIENARLYDEMAKLNRAYERFVPSQFLQFLNKSSIVDVKLGDQIQLEMSVLFSDIRDFTTLSESMTPADNFKFINAYLSRMETPITENHGFIDKYIGDAIMALFSGEADNSVKAGIAMLQLLAEYNTTRGRVNRPKLQIGIGINTGSLMLGTVGGQNRMDGTVISDAVNLASRVESLTKNYGVALLITEQTYSKLKNPSNYHTRIIDKVKVKGKSQPVTVYEVFDADLPEIKDQKLATLSIFIEALSLYNQNKLVDAGHLFNDCLQKNPGDHVAQIYCQRCEN